jgi:3-hydroxybutyryl-CoA dehydrogenase
MNIKSIGVIGAGTMGSGIVSACAVSGFKTYVHDVSESAIDNAVKNIHKGFSKLVEKGKLSPEKKSAAEHHIIKAASLESLAECDCIIEAAAEDMVLKKELFLYLGDMVKPATILASNTSSFSITAISSSLKTGRERVVGMHFFNPANIMKLVEVVQGRFTTDEVMNSVIELCKKLGKTPVICKDTPAFIVNRVARAFYGESLKIMGEENLAPETIDTIMKEEGGFAMGPFELMDMIGIDINLSVTKSVYEAFFYDQKYKPSPIQQKMVDAGLLGRKTGEGFYKY